RRARHASSVRPARTTFRPKLEVLEDRCLFSAGALDPTYGRGGLVTGTIQSPQAIVVQSDGKIVVAGNGGGLERVNPNGRVDSSFGNNGTTVPVSEGFSALAIDANSKIVAVGPSSIPVAGQRTDEVT